MVWSNNINDQNIDKYPKYEWLKQLSGIFDKYENKNSDIAMIPFKPFFKKNVPIYCEIYNWVDFLPWK